MFERVDVAAASHQQASIDELGQGGAERGLVHVENGRQQPRRELAADGGADLRDLLYRRHAVETGHERVVQARWDRQRRQRAAEAPGVAILAEQSGFQHGLGQFFDEQRHAVRLGHDLVQDFLGERLAAGEVADRPAQALALKRFIASCVRCAREPQGGTNSGRCVISISTRRSPR